MFYFLVIYSLSLKKEVPPCKQGKVDLIFSGDGWFSKSIFHSQLTIQRDRGPWTRICRCMHQAVTLFVIGLAN